MADIELPNPDDIAEQKKDKFTKIAALTVACYAVVLAIASLGGANAAKEVNLTQQQASNQWAHYQARVIREHGYRIAQKQQQIALATYPAERRKQAEELQKEFADEEKRYNQEKRENMAKAKKLEDERDINLRKDPYFDYAEVLLQIAIVIASVSMLANSRPVYLMSIVLAIGGATLTINGYLLLVRVPLLDSPKSEEEKQAAVMQPNPHSLAHASGSVPKGIPFTSSPTPRVVPAPLGVLQPAEGGQGGSQIAISVSALRRRFGTVAVADG